MQGEQLRTLLSTSLQQKVDFRDLDGFSHQLHAKADVERVQDLVGQLRAEVLGQLQQIKKEQTGKARKKEEELKKKKQEAQVASEKAFEEIRALKEKMQKLAAQFDKELSERDKQIRTAQAMSQGDMHKVFGNIQLELENLRKILSDLELRKAEKRDFADLKLALSQDLDAKAARADLQSALAGLGAEQTQKQFDLRQELFRKVTDIQSKFGL